MADTPRRRNAPPSVRRRMLGVALRRRRESLILSREAVAERMGWSESKVYRLERGSSEVDHRDIADLCKQVFRVSREEKARLVQLAKDSRRVGWWMEYRDVLGAGHFVALEDEASKILAYEGHLIPGLLQTPEYARVVIRSLLPFASEQEIDRRVQVRMARQSILHGDDPPQFLVILHAGALRQCRESAPRLARSQFAALLEALRHPNITILILPFDAGFEGSVEGFAILDFPEGVEFRFAYVGSLTGGIYIEGESSVEIYTQAWKRMRDRAMSEDETAAFLRAELEGLR